MDAASYIIQFAACLVLALAIGGSEVRLVRDGVECTNCGRVEVYMSGQWGTVCSNLWNEQDARVVCRQLNFSTGGKPAKYAAFGEGTGPIHMSHVDCHGNETSITQCSRRGGSSCDHEDDAGVICESAATAELTGSTRLEDGTNAYSGRIGIQYHSVWGTVCRDGWHIQNAKVTCREQGYCGGSSVIHDNGAFGLGSGPVWLSEVNCTGSEYKLEYCQHNGWANNSCDHSYDVGVVCQLCDTGSMRLVGGTNATAGIVAISNNGIWGTMCSDSWHDTEASVVCRSLGFSGGEVAESANFTYQTGSIWLSGVKCSGQELHVTECSYDHKGSGGWGDNDCRHYQDVAVTCYNSPLTSTVMTVSPTTVSATTIPSTTEHPGDKKMDKTWIIIIVVIIAVVVIAVVLIVVFGVLRKRNSKPSHLMVPRGEPNEYRMNYNDQEGTCAITPIRMPSDRHGKACESGIYDEIDEPHPTTSAQQPARMNSYTIESPGSHPDGTKARGKSVPLPAIPDDNEYLTAVDTANILPDQDVYTQIDDDQNTADYLEPLKLKS